MTKQKTVLLTGATGFLGSHLLDALIAKRFNVVILKRTTSDPWRIEHLLDKVVSYDVDALPLEVVFEQHNIDVVIHTACHYGRNGDTLCQIVESNLMFGLRILDACLTFNTSTFINTGTLLPNNLNPYSLSKSQLVDWLRQSSDKMTVLNLQLEHMFGPKDDATKFVSWILSQFKSNAPEIKLTEGDQLRDFIYIDDVVSAYLTVLSLDSEFVGFNEFDVGTGNLLSVKDFLEELQCVYEADVGSVSTKLHFGAIPYREGEIMTVDVNNELLMSLGWKPKTALKDGLKNIIKEYV